MDKMTLYGRLPIFAQNWACSLEGRRICHARYGKGFWEKLKSYESRAAWSPERLAEYRDSRLRAMVKHCYETVPYYRRTFKEGGVSPNDIRELADLSKLPILTKEVVNKNPKEFLSSAYAGKTINHHTSGTTGSGFVFAITPESQDEQWACWWRFRRALGIEFGTPQAMFGTQKVVPVKQKKPPFWRMNLAEHRVYFSAFHESDRNLAAYCEKLIRERIPWIHGYPSLLAPIAAFAAAHDIGFDDIRFVTTGAENLLESQAALIENAFGVRPYQHYGMCEGIANFSENLDHRMFVDEDFAAVEFVGQPGEAVCRIIGTTLTNFAMPLLRWDVGDVGRVKTHADGRREVISLDGRAEDSVILPDGTCVGKLDHVFKDTIHIAEAQIHQHADHSITVYAKKTQEDVSEDERIARMQFAKSFTCEVPIRFEYVEAVPRAKSGKLRFVVSEIRGVAR